MKKIAFLLAFILLAGFALADSLDYKNMNEEELVVLRNEKIKELTEINMALGTYAKEKALQPVKESLGKIKDLFPDEVMACYVRDRVKKFSIEQEVTQEELDKVTSVFFWATNEYPKDITGIGYLRNISSCTVGTFRGHFLPDDMQNCTKLESIWFGNSSVEAIPEWIGNLTMLKEIEINRGSIKEIPASIGNLTRLERLTIEDNDIESIPETIANCTSLKCLELGNNNIATIPESMWSMEFEELVLSGNPIR